MPVIVVAGLACLWLQSNAENDAVRACGGRCKGSTACSAIILQDVSTVRRGPFARPPS